MKHGKNPTVAQANIIAAHLHSGKNLNPANWLVVKNLPDKLVIRHRNTPSIIKIPIGRS